MIVDHHNYFDKPITAKATRVVIHDNLGNPVALFIENADDTVTCYTAGDQDFAEILTQCGIKPPNIKIISIGG
jgi:hypothetical protein